MSPPKPVGSSLEPEIGVLRCVGGMRAGDASFEMVPTRTVRNREAERLFVLLHLSGDAPDTAYQGLRETIANAYWATPGSITAALREAAALANRLLFRANVQADPAERFYGHLVCAVMAGDDLFVLQAGSAWGGVLKGHDLQVFGRGGKLPPLGIAAVADVALSHSSIASQDTLVLSVPLDVPTPDQPLLTRQMRAASLGDVLEGLLRYQPTGDRSCLVARWGALAEAHAALQPEAGRRVLLRPRRRGEREQPGPAAEPPDERVPIVPPAAPVPVPSRGVPLAPVVAEVWAREGVPEAAEQPKPEEAREPEPERIETTRVSAGPAAGERLQTAAHAVGRRIASASVAVGRGIRRLFWRMLPGAEREAPRPARVRRAPPAENRAVMVTTAAVIPLVLLVTVLATYRSFGAQARFDTLMNEARAQAEQAVAAGQSPDVARVLWTNVVTVTGEATRLRPGDPGAVALVAQAQAALDELDHVRRIEALPLSDLGPARDGQPRQLVVRGQHIYILDPGNGWMAQATLDASGTSLEAQPNGETLRVIVRTGAEAGGAPVGRLVGLAWASAEGGRQTPNVVILEAGSALLGYDPAWGANGDAPQVTRLALAGSHPGAVSLSAFEGRVYVLEPDANQIWRYVPQGDAYPQPPEPYFAEASPVPLATALDMEIDGSVYVLFEGGELLKFLRGQLAQFEVRGLPDGLDGAVGIAADATGSSDVIYVADRGGTRCHGRVVALATDGLFRHQLCAEGAFDDLEAIAFDALAGRLFVINHGRLYVARLP